MVLVVVETNCDDQSFVVTTRSRTDLRMKYVEEALFYANVKQLSARFQMECE